MFTGIVEATGKIASVESDRSNKIFWVESELAGGLKVDESLSHNGVCLTIEAKTGTSHRVSAVNETLNKTNLGSLATGDIINLERPMEVTDRFHGHFVQGHIDGTAVCTDKKETPGSWIFSFEFNRRFAPLIIEKGSVCVNGVSLTAFEVGINNFKVAVIPYTYDHTNFSFVTIGTIVNIEFDMMGKYIQRYLEVASQVSI
jgi:riboflavin synthase